MIALDGRPVREAWQYPHADPSILLFGEALRRFPLRLQSGVRVLELGCCENDFSTWLRAAVPGLQLIGCDVHVPQKYDGELRIQPAETLDLPRASFDAVIALGSIEHFGLGFYGDPLCEDADAIVAQQVASWLKPGGWFYYDVPWTPERFYITENRHFRVYDDAALEARLTAGLRAEGRFYAHGETNVVQPGRPTAPASPFWYVCRSLRKGPQ